VNDREASLPRAHGAAVLTAKMRSVPEDFFVEELPGFEPSGSGEHLLLTVEKRGINTAFAARRIAQWAGVGEVGIGYAGMKDRHAVTRQRFSVHLPKKVAPDLATLDFIEGEERLTVVEHVWHAKKLPRGALAGNRFVLTLRGVEGDRAAVEQRLRALAERGVPNYFGEQRTLLISAARSELFNRVLAARVRDGRWDTPLDGEVWMLDGSRSVFGPEPFSDELAQRLAAFDVHPTGPLWGRGDLRTTGDTARLELSAMEDDEALALRGGLEAEGLKQERRALRLRPSGLTWTWRDDDVLELAFGLPPGAYATVVLAELGDVRSVGRAG
jgi:tRNA pseudouridine13 synthase